MNIPKSHIQSPVERSRAEYYLLLMLLSFAASVTLTRTFLFLTGYPQIGGGGLHIAHVLWGGLILFSAALLPLIFANRWFYTLGAILSGMGMGLFIDEVGKFITQDNNYFYPPAAPIIYAFFLLSVLVYYQVRRPSPRNPRAELYLALDGLEDVLDHDLDARELKELEGRLRYVALQADQPDLARLAKELLDFLSWGKIPITPHLPSFWEKIMSGLQAFENRYLTRPRLRAILTAGVGVLGLVTLSTPGQTLISGYTPSAIEQTQAALARIGITTASGLNWLMARVILESFVGMALFISAVLLGVGKDRLGAWGSFLSLLLSLTIVDMLLFYFEQFSTIATASIQLVFLLAVLHYRRKYLQSTFLS